MAVLVDVEVTVLDGIEVEVLVDVGVDVRVKVRDSGVIEGMIMVGVGVRGSTFGT